MLDFGLSKLRSGLSFLGNKAQAGFNTIGQYLNKGRQYLDTAKGLGNKAYSFANMVAPEVARAVDRVVDKDIGGGESLRSAFGKVDRGLNTARAYARDGQDLARDVRLGAEGRSDAQSRLMDRFKNSEMNRELQKRMAKVGRR